MVRVRAMRTLENAVRRWGFYRVAGCDEVGRGCLAGPVVAGAVILDPESHIPGLSDSKTITAAERERLHDLITRKALAWSVAWADPEEIDTINIHQASLQAMRRAVLAIAPLPDMVLVDAFRIPDIEIAQRGVLHGDRRCAAIAAASIVAKVTRDRQMMNYHERDPRYGVLLAEIMPPYLHGVAQDAAALDAADKLEPRTAKLAGLGRRLGGRALRRALRRRDATSARINAIFDDHDVVLTPVVAQPPEPVGTWAGKGPLRTFNGGGPYVGYTAVWNLTGNPAAALPAGTDDAGLPLAVQLVARPGSEATLLALSAQLEAVRPWAQRTPPVV